MEIVFSEQLRGFVYGDPEFFQKVRDETVDYLIANKGWFSQFDTDIDARLSEQLMDRTWGITLRLQQCLSAVT